LNLTRILVLVSRSAGSTNPAKFYVLVGFAV
jgi:hypothetical protein